LDWKRAIIASDAPLTEAMRVIGASRRHICLVVDGSGRLLGTVTDGDIRRAILRAGLDQNAGQVMFTTPTVGHPGESRDVLLARARTHSIRDLPIVDESGRVVGLESIEDLVPVAGGGLPNAVVLMAGGLGTRLRPMTETVPKPLIKVGERPILLSLMDSLLAHDFRRFYVAVNYKAEMVMSALGDGSQWGASITYLRENERLGTAGPLSLMDDLPSHPVLVMNADILTKVNFSALLRYHQEQAAAATMCVREYDIQVPFGVVDMDDEHRITGIVEKPVHRFFVNAGIYVIEPRLLSLVPRGTFYDMPDMFQAAIDRGDKVASFPIGEYWTDIGRPADLEQANGDYAEIFGAPVPVLKVPGK